MAAAAVRLHGSPRVAWAVRGGQALAAAGLAAFVLHETGAVAADLGGLFDNWVYSGLLVLASVGRLARAVAVRQERVAWLLMGLGIPASSSPGWRTRRSRRSATPSTWRSIPRASLP